MSEYIEREALMRNLKQFAPEQLTPLIESLIQKQPAEDVVEVVRCKNCKNYELMKSNNSHFCNKFGGYVTEDDFCSRAQKMDGGTNDDSKKSVRASK